MDSPKYRELYRVTTSYFCCGLLVQADRVVDAAPIMKWAIGNNLGYVARWVKGKGGTMENLGDGEDTTLQFDKE